MAISKECAAAEAVQIVIHNNSESKWFLLAVLIALADASKVCVVRF